MSNPPIAPKHQSGQRSILVVDDVEANRAILSRRLEKFGYLLTMADSGQQALLHVAAAPPDLILLDYMMPQMNGIEVLQALRGDVRTREIPVIMVTARTEGDAIVHALEAGADDYVTKPIDFDILRARIETQFNKHTNATDLRRANAVLDERVSLRAMALAELQDELERESARRIELEREIAQLKAPQRSAAGDAGVNEWARLSRARDIVEALFARAAAGEQPNLALLAELRQVLSALC